DYSRVALDDSQWTPVQLPHRTWGYEQDKMRAYGWYRQHFTPAQGFEGRDMILKLGIVDDVDETYCNGEKVGATGSLPPKSATAYNVDREYVIPARLLRYGQDNVIAVKAYNITGTGGLLGAPRLGYRVVPTDEWLFKPTGRDQTTDYSQRHLDDTSWDRVPMPDDTWSKRQPGGKQIGWYRLHFVVPNEWRGKTLVLDLGLILDADETYFNGEWIARTGTFPPEPFSVAGEPRLYQLPPDCIRYGRENVLAIKVFNDCARGGIWGRPAFMDLAAGLAAEGTLDHAIRLRHAMYYDDAERTLTALFPQARTDADRADLLDELTVVDAALGRDDDALATFQRLMREYPYESCSRDAVHAICRIQSKRGALTPEVVRLDEDRYTQGRWQGVYGNAGFVLCGMTSDLDVIGLPGRLGFSGPSSGAHGSEARPEPAVQYRAFLFSPQHERPAIWVGTRGSTDPRVLTDPILRARTWAVWDDVGETHPFDNGGPDVGAEINLREGWWRCSAYFLDWDWWNTWHPRQHGVVLMGEDGQVLAVADTAKHGQGVWVRFAVKGPRKITWRVCKNRSPCASVSGLFIDRWLPPAPARVGDPSAGSSAPNAGDDQYARLSTAEVPTPETIADRRALAAALDARARKGVELDTTEAWALWQTAAQESPFSPSAVRGFRAWVSAVKGTGEGAALSTLRGVGNTLFQTQQYHLSHLAMDEGDALQLARPLSPADAQAFTADVVKWWPVADEYALSRFDRFLKHMDGLPPGSAAVLIGAASAQVMDQPEECAPATDTGGELPQAPTYPLAPRPIPTPAGRIVAWYLAHDPTLAQLTAPSFLELRGRSAISGTRAAYERGDWQLALREGLKAVQLGRLLPDALDVAPTRLLLLRSARWSSQPQTIVDVLTATRTDTAVQVSENLLRGRLLAQVGLLTQSVTELREVAAGSGALPPAQRIEAYKQLGVGLLHVGDLAGSERAMRELLVASETWSPILRASAALSAYEILGQVYVYSGRQRDLPALSKEIEEVMMDAPATARDLWAREQAVTTAQADRLEQR
ncbi:hypothetical protein LLH03_06690, partial [bacterium]|nr:hypothetical protein [bacterium]